MSLYCHSLSEKSEKSEKEASTPGQERSKQKNMNRARRKKTCRQALMTLCASRLSVEGSSGLAPRPT